MSISEKIIAWERKNSEKTRKNIVQPRTWKNDETVSGYKQKKNIMQEYEIENH